MGPGADLREFVIEAVAGRGGMGVVYRAQQKTPTRIVALKVISTDLAEDPQFRVRFQSEAAIAAQIEHPNVILVYAVGDANGTLFIAMRFVDGLDLRALLAEEPRLEPRTGGFDRRPGGPSAPRRPRPRTRPPRRQAGQHPRRDDRRAGAHLPHRLRRLAPDRRDQRADGNRGVHRHDRLRRPRAGARGARRRAL